MERREALKNITLSLGAVLSSTTIAAVLSHCSSEKRYDLSGPLQFFNEEQFQVISAVADRIIPKTDTPGAIDVKVPEFIDLMLFDCYEKDDQRKFIGGLQNIAGAVEVETGNSINELGAADLEKFLSGFEQKVLSDPESADQSFCLKTLKELTLLGYCTSMEGATQVLQYIPVPGKYEPCTDLEDQRTSVIQ